LVSPDPRTLESIGQEYGITRERVRQIEAFALNKIRKSDQYKKTDDVFGELKDHIDYRGGVVHEKHFLETLSKKPQDENFIYFLLSAGESFEHLKEDDHFDHSWTVDMEKARQVREALKRLHLSIKDDQILSEKEIIDMFSGHLRDVAKETSEERILKLLLKMSKRVAPNALGEWGSSSSAFIRPRGMRDYAFLVMRRHGSPMHFSEVAKAINSHFDRPSHMQTVHNELIKDDRFVLVGRGLYALKEWGYEGGIVRTVIQKILGKDGALTKEEIIKRVLKERYVKENTILVNLQNGKYFAKDGQGNYTLLS
jgi:hypothetical protein